jgi:hypothetical protein
MASPCDTSSADESNILVPGSDRSTGTSLHVRVLRVLKGITLKGADGKKVQVFFIMCD